MLITDKQKQFAELGRRLFPIKKETPVGEPTSLNILEPLLNEDVSAAFGCIAHALHEAKEEARECRELLMKRDEEVLADYKAAHEEKYAGSIYTLSPKEKKQHDKFFAEHTKKHDKLGEFIYHIYPTSLGECIICECPVCHETEDITDTSKW